MGTRLRLTSIANYSLMTMTCVAIPLALPYNILHSTGYISPLLTDHQMFGGGVANANVQIHYLVIYLSAKLQM